MLAIAADGYFSRANLTDLFLANVPVLIIALGATLVIVCGEIDISVGSVFAICSVVAGLSSKAGLPVPAVMLVVVLAGGALGALNGALVAFARIPSIVVTLATMVGLRDALRWATQGAWVQDLPASFQWLGFSQSAYPMVTAAAVGLARRDDGVGRPPSRGGPRDLRDRVQCHGARAWPGSISRGSNGRCSRLPAC